MFLFAFLFGYGAQIQFERRKDIHEFSRYWRNRMLVLSVFGIMHILLFWFGDILLPYALLGLLIPAFVRLKPKTLFIVGFISYTSSALFVLLQKLLDLADFSIQSALSLEEFISVYSNSGFADLFPFRMEEFFSLRNEKLAFYMPKELALFCFGIASAKLNWVLTFKPAVKWIIIALFAAITWNVFKDEYFGLFNHEQPPVIPFLIVQNVIFEIILGYAYIAGFVYLYKLKVFDKVFDILAKVGRMSLTNYFLQSVVCVLLFYGYGLGWYGSKKPTELLFLTVVIFSAQCVFSVFWLRFYRQGPLEFVWRKATGFLTGHYNRTWY